MSTNSNPLTNAVAEAMKSDTIVEQVEELHEGNKTKATEDSTETTKVEKEETKVEQEPELSEEAKQGIALLKLLQNPDTAAETMKLLQKQIFGEETSSKKEVKQQAKTIKEAVVEELGEEYQFLADKLGNAFEKVLNLAEQKIVEKQVNPLKAELEKAQAIQAAKEVETAWETVSKETKGGLDKHEKEISKLMDRYKPEKGVTMEDYLRDLYSIVDQRATKAQLAKSQNEKINKNANDKQSLSSEANENRIKRGSSLPSLKEAVMAASRNEIFED